MTDDDISKIFNLLKKQENSTVLKIVEDLSGQIQEHPELLFGKAVALARLNQHAEAGKNLEQLLKLCPNATWLHNDSEISDKAEDEETLKILVQEAVSALSERDFSTALLKLQAAGKIAPEGKELNYLESLCYVGLNNYDKARECLEKELALYPDSEDAKAMLEAIEADLKKGK